MKRNGRDSTKKVVCWWLSAREDAQSAGLFGDIAVSPGRGCDCSRRQSRFHLEFQLTPFYASQPKIRSPSRSRCAPSPTETVASLNSIK